MQDRLYWLLGNNYEKIKDKVILIIGLGGVGSYCLETLARTYFKKMIIVDGDKVDISNLNRQIHATQLTVGNVKVEAMKERILSINPNCNVETKQIIINADNIGEVIKEDIYYVVDAIDTVTSKLALAKYCYENGIKIISSMGTGNKMDPTQFRVTDITKTKVCPLAKVMRSELKKRGVKKLKVVYSEEIPMTPNRGEAVPSQKRQTPGSISFVPSVAGLIIGGEVIKDIIADNN